MEMHELYENMYVEITKDIHAMEVPEGTLGIVTTVFDDPRILKANEPYVAIVETIPDRNLAVSLDEIRPITVGGEPHA